MTALPFFAANVAAPQLAAPAAAVSTHPFPAASQQDIAAAGTPVSGFENLVQLFLQGEEADSALLEPNPAPADGSAASPTVNTNIVPVVMSVITQPPVITDLRTPEQQLEEHEERPEEECQVPTGMLLSVSPANPTAAPSPNKEVEVQDAQDQSVAESDRKPAPPPQCRPAVVEFPALAVEQPTMEDAAPDVITEQQDIEQPGVEPPETQEHPARDQIRVATGNQPGGASKAIQPAIRDKVVIEGTHNGEAPANEAFALEVHTSPEVGAQEPNRDRQTTKAKAQPMENAPRPTTPRVSTEPTRQNDTGTSQKEHRHPTESHQSAPKEQETTAQPASTARTNPIHRSTAGAEPPSRDHASHPNAASIAGPGPRDPQPSAQQPLTPAAPASSAQPPSPPPAANHTVQQIEALRLAGVQLGFRPQQPVQNLELRVPAAGGPVDVRLIDHGGRIEIAVRAADPGLAQDLRQQLPDLVERLDSHGYSLSGTERSRAESIQNSAQARQGQESAYSDQQGQQQQQQRRDRQAELRRGGNPRKNDVPAFRIEPGDFQTGAL